MDDKVEIVFSFDTTGSMAPCIGQVRQNLEGAISGLLKEVPNLKIGLTAHGDYCDRHSTYVTKHLDLTSDIYSLVNFARTAGRTGGGDSDECYELVLHEAQSVFNWSVNAKKILVVIGDANPHPQNYHLNSLRLDWSKEAWKLVDMGVSIYTIQCLSRSSSTSFYSMLAEIGKGFHLELDQFQDINTLMNAIVYRQVSEERVQKYEEDISTKGKMTRSLDLSFRVLRGQPRDDRGRFVSYKHVSEDGSALKPVPAGRFQILDVKDDIVIKDFVQDHDLEFKPGRGFYEFTKRETIQDRKEIVIRDRVTGDMFTGSSARELLGIPMGMGRNKVSPKHGDKYDVFVQSTSYNRKLIGGSKFLYEVDMER